METLKKNLPYIFIFIIIYFLISSLNKNNDLESKNTILKYKFDESQSKAQSYIDEYNKIKPLILNLNTEISNLKKLSLEKQNQYLILDKKYHENIKVISKFSINDMQLYFNNRYGTKSNGYTTRFDTIKSGH